MVTVSIVSVSYTHLAAQTIYMKEENTIKLPEELREAEVQLNDVKQDVYKRQILYLCYMMKAMKNMLQIRSCNKTIEISGEKQWKIL